MSLQISPSVLATSLCFLVSTSACAGLAQLSNKRKTKKAPTVAERDAAADDAVAKVAADGDLPRLLDICWGKDKTVSSNAWTKACHDGRRIALETYKREATCSNAVDMWKKYEKYLNNNFRGGTKQVEENFVFVGTKIAKCGNTDFVFEDLVHRGGSRGKGSKLLYAMDEAGIDVEGKLLDYMKRNRGSLFTFKNARFALEHLFDYLHKKSKHARCNEYFPYARTMNDDLFGPFNWFFRESQCKGAETLAVARLTSDRVGTRQGACKTLGVLGNARHLRKVRILATTDPYSKVREERRNGRIWAVKAWPVREACKAAAGKIQLRN